MFQYAFGLAAARILGVTFAFHDSMLRDVFVLGRHEADRVHDELPTVSVANDSYREPEEVLASLLDTRRYDGYFQSERFFQAASNQVRAAFRLKAKHRDAFRSSYGDLVSGGYVCCHLRRTDYDSFAGGVQLPMSYYAEALHTLSIAAGTSVVFVGDDLDQARAVFADVEGARFEHNDEPVDLQLLSHASAVIVSNSTFGWWGAWLNERAAKRVIAPRHWLGFNFGWEYPPHVIPSEWTQLSVRRSWRRRFSPVHLRMSAGRARLAAVERLRRA